VVPSPQGPSYAAPLVGFQLGQSIADLPDAYMKGREQKRARSMQDMFAGGLPQNEDGSTNWTAALQKYLQEGAKIGGGQFVGQYVPQLLDEEQARNAYAISRGQPIGPSAFFGPAPGQANGPADPGNLQPTQQAPIRSQPLAAPRSGLGAGNNGAETIRSLVTGLAGGREASPAISEAVRQFRIGPDADLSPEQVKAVTAAIGPKLRGGGRSDDAGAADGGGSIPFAPGIQPPTGGPSGAPAPAGGRAPNAVAQAGGGTANVDAAGGGGGGLRPTPVGTEAEARMKERSAVDKEAAAAYSSKRNPTLSKDLMEQAQADRKRASEIRTSLGEYNKPTGEMMNAEASGFKSPIDAKAAGKFSEDIAGAKAKNVAARIEGIRPAQDSIQVLDEMMNAFRAGGTNISTGPGAQQWLKVKQAVNNQIPGFFKGVPEAEEVDKLNSYLASAVAKAMTPRPTQYEFKAFQQQTPGLLTSREGSAVLADILRQTKVQELELGRIADKFDSRGGKSWSDVEEKYFKEHPIISPQTHKPIDAVKAPDGKWYRPDPDRPGKYIVER
jgi:hypothetical protein